MNCQKFVIQTTAMTTAIRTAIMRNVLNPGGRRSSPPLLKEPTRIMNTRRTTRETARKGIS